MLAKRWLMLSAELKELDATLDRLTSQSAKRLRNQFGVGPQTAATLIAAARDNPERLRNKAALAALCGASPLQASSGKTARHRLNRGGDRPANNALWTIAMVRMRSEPRTQAYVMRRTAQGMSNKEIQRCLKRVILFVNCIRLFSQICQMRLQLLDIGASMPQPKVASTASRTSEYIDCVMKHAQRWLPWASSTSRYSTTGNGSTQR